ncbi:MAG: NHL repeat-containing protein [Deltaproteobacteria bacterium]|nr:NHL repeat-containing protein [Deltaproteobacteria bacterium]
MPVRSAQKNGGFAAAAIIFLGLSLSVPTLGFAQSCRWGSSVEAPPSSVPLRAYRDFFHAPGRVAVDGSGNVYTTDPRAGQVFIRDQYGRLINVLEGLNLPLGIAVDNAERIYVGEHGKGSVTVFDQQWNRLNVFGQGDGEFLIPNDIAVDPQSGWIYVSDSGAHTIRVYAPDGTLLSSFGGPGTGPGQFNFPAGLYMSPLGELFVADQTNDRIQVFDRNGNFLRCIGGSAFSFSSKFGRILGLTGDSQGRLYVADAFQGYVQVFDRFGYRLSTIGTFGNGPGQLRTPMGLAIDIHNRLFVASANTGRVEFFGLDSFSDPHIIPAVVDIQPDTLNRSANRDYITAYIEIRDYSVDQIDPATITANGVPALASRTTIGDYDADGIPDLMVKFDAQTMLAALPDGNPIIVVSGMFWNGNPFEGSDSVRVNSSGGNK